MTVTSTLQLNSSLTHSGAGWRNIEMATTQKLASCFRTILRLSLLITKAMHWLGKVGSAMLCRHTKPFSNRIQNTKTRDTIKPLSKRSLKAWNNNKKMDLTKVRISSHRSQNNKGASVQTRRCNPKTIRQVPPRIRRRRTKAVKKTNSRRLTKLNLVKVKNKRLSAQKPLKHKLKNKVSPTINRTVYHPRT